MNEEEILAELFSTWEQLETAHTEGVITNCDFNRRMGVANTTAIVKALHAPLRAMQGMLP